MTGKSQRHPMLGIWWFPSIQAMNAKSQSSKNSFPVQCHGVIKGTYTPAKSKLQSSESPSHPVTWCMNDWDMPISIARMTKPLFQWSSLASAMTSLSVPLNPITICAFAQKVPVPDHIAPKSLPNPHIPSQHCPNNIHKLHHKGAVSTK